VAINHNLNPWGRSSSDLDVQRTDLWYLDMSSVVTALGKTSDPAYQAFKPLWPKDSSETMWWTKSCSLPQQGVTPVTLNQGTGRQIFPSTDLDAGQVQLQCYLDTSSIGGSKVMATLMGWDTLRSTGHVDPYRPLPLLASASTQVTWTFDLTLLLMKGTLDGKSLDASGAWKLSRCWLESFQVSDFNQSSQGEPQTVSVMLQAGAIWPVDPATLGYTASAAQNGTQAGESSFDASNIA